MEDILKEYYDIYIESYYMIDNSYIFNIGNDTYYLYKYDIECNLDFVFEIYNYVIVNSRLKIHNLIKNKYGEYVSNDYVLMKINVLISGIDYNDVLMFSRCNMDMFSKYYIDVKSLWINKLDLIENDINNYIDNIRYDFYYYLGVMEILLSYVNDMDIKYEKLVLSHKKRYNNSIDYYNPFNFCIDLKYRDLIYYLINIDDVDNILKYSGGINEYEMRYIIFRLLIPYDFFDNMDNSNGSDIVNYEILLNKIKDLFNLNLFNYIKKEVIKIPKEGEH